MGFGSEGALLSNIIWFFFQMQLLLCSSSQLPARQGGEEMKCPEKDSHQPAV